MSVTDCAIVATGDSDAAGEGEGNGEALGSAAAIQLELRPSKQISAHKILFTTHHCIDGSRTKGALSALLCRELIGDARIGIDL